MWHITDDGKYLGTMFETYAHGNFFNFKIFDFVLFFLIKIDHLKYDK